MRLRDESIERMIRAADATIRRGTVEPAEGLKLAKELISALQFGRARYVLALARRGVAGDGEPGPRGLPVDPLALRLAQKHALATYKDPDLPARSRLDEAWRILAESDDPDDLARDRGLSGPGARGMRQETLGLAGAICKRVWQMDNLRLRLEQALGYYLRGYELGCENDVGHTGINGAFVLDLLAGLESESVAEGGVIPDSVGVRRRSARRIRSRLVEDLPSLEQRDDNAVNWWFPATLAEAHFGLGDFAAAKAWADKCATRKTTPAWERESTVWQLVALAFALRLPETRTVDGFIKSEAGQVLVALLGGGEDGAAAVQGVMSARVGRVGLALSGGGFRASLFHIGVLARLAELDVLRHVEVLSCVSGGSIVGAQYYLEVRRLLQASLDKQISQADYVKVVQKLERDFLAGVQKNLRTRVIGNPLANLRMIFAGSYSRTMRLGELYEKHLFSRVEDEEGHEPRWLGLDPTNSEAKSLHVLPAGEDRAFHPRRDNWRRKNKVPILVLNATTLNTGHSWQFTASWMGEPPAAEINMNACLRRKYYDQPQAGRVRLGQAVAASSCVPGLFPPVVLDKLYRDWTVRLVDGGVHDNQGVVGLLDQDCNVLIVSDASGQMDSQKQPSGGLIGVPLRSSSILGARIRDAQFVDLKARRRSGLLREMLFVHLKQDLDGANVDWIGCDDAWTEVAARPRPEDPTSYGVRKDVQALLAALRTDLDSFTDTEAHALMASGYLMASRLFERHMRGFPHNDLGASDWRFLRVRPALEGDASTPALKRHLSVGGEAAFKVWRLYKPLTVFGWLLGVAALAAFVWLLYAYRKQGFPVVGWVGSLLAGLAVSAVLGAKVKTLIWWRTLLMRIAVGIALGFVGWGIAWLHLGVFDRLFLALGRVQRALRVPARAPAP